MPTRYPPKLCIYGIGGQANESICFDTDQGGDPFEPSPMFPEDWFTQPVRPPAPRPAPPAAPRVLDTGVLNMLDPLPRGPSDPNRTRPAVPARPSIIFGAATPQPAPAPRPRRRPRRRSRPAPRRGRPTRRPTPRIPWPEPPQSPTPDSPPRPAKAPGRRPLPIPTSVPDALFGLWWRLWEEYLTPRRRRTPGGGPRRGGARTRQPTSPGRVTVPMPGPLPVDLPTRSTERSPRQSEIFQPPAALPSPFPDPYATPAPAPGTPRQQQTAPAARSRSRLFQLGNPLAWSMPQVRTGSRRDPSRNRGREPSSTQRFRDTLRGNIGDFALQPKRPQLTPLQRGRLDLQSQPSQDPCAQRARDQKRRQRERRKNCKRWVKKEIFVCRSS